MDAEPGDGRQGTAGAGSGGDATPAEAGAAQAAETERMVGQIVDDGLAATGYVPAGVATTMSAAAAAAAESDATDRALFVLRTLDDIAAPVPMGRDPTPSPPPPDVSTTKDGLLEFEGVDLDADDMLLARPAPGSSFQVRHRYNVAQVGVGIVALSAFLGAILFVSGSTGPPAASPAASGAAVVVGPSGAATPVTPLPTPDPSPEPSAAATDPATPPPTAAPTGAPPTAVPQSTTLRGPIDVRAMTKTGLTIGQHDLELVVFNDTGEVTGSFVIAIDDFPIGALLAGMAANLGGGDDPDLAVFKKCTVRLVLEGAATGTYDATTGKLGGKVRFQPVSDDVHDCLKNRPSNLTIDPNDAVEATTVKWSATFDGRKAKGRLALDPVMSFSATAAD